MDAQERERLRAMLEGSHAFPCPYYFSVITTNDDGVTAALRAVVASLVDAPVPDDAWERRASSGGKYASHRVTLQCRSADHVLELYARVREVRGVVTVL